MFFVFADVCIFCIVRPVVASVVLFPSVSKDGCRTKDACAFKDGFVESKTIAEPMAVAELKTAAEPKTVAELYEGLLYV